MARTGVAFGVFGAGGLLIGLTLVVLGGLQQQSEANARRAQRWIHRGYRFFLWFTRVTGLVEVHFEGEERLREPGPHFIVANHPTMMDCAVIVSRLPQADCIAKAAWAHKTWLNQAARAADYLIADDGPEVVEEGARRLRAGRTLVMFPEGTRSPEGGLGPFYRGAAHIALRSGSDLLPVLVRVDPPTLMKGQPWWHVPKKRIRFVVSVGDPISPKFQLEGTESRAVAARKLTRTLREHYEKRLLCGES